MRSVPLLPLALLLTSCATTTPNPPTTHPTQDQQLILACHAVRPAEVARLLRAGANPNATYNSDDKTPFIDPWTASWQMDLPAFTPLLALARSTVYPDPPYLPKNETEQDQLRVARFKVPQPLLDQRKQAVHEIFLMLVSHGADVSTHDLHGGSALSDFITREDETIATELIELGADVNQSARIYIDGIGHIAPIHAAIKNPRLLKLLLAHGANPNVRDTANQRPLDWALDGPYPESVKLLDPVTTIPPQPRPAHPDLTPFRPSLL